MCHSEKATSLLRFVEHSELFVGGSPRMRGLLTAAHAPQSPAEHARLACCARVRGLPPPGASRSSRFARSLLPAPSPREGLFGTPYLFACAWTVASW